MIEIETSSGFVAKVDENAFLEDYELLEAVAGLEKQDLSALLYLQNGLLGKEQAEALKNHLRGENGKVSTAAMMTAISEIIKGGAPKKS